MNGTEKTTKVKTTTIKWYDWVTGTVATLILAAGTLRAVQLEAQKGQQIVYACGILVVAYSLQAIVRLVRR